MNRWRPDDFERREPAFGLAGDALEGPAAGLLITCTAECFPPAALTAELAPGAWTVHRTPGNVVPPFGAGCPVEEKLLERAVTELQVGTLVVCGHHPCAIAAHLLEDGEPADDFVLRDWLSHAEAARRVVQGHDARAAAAHNVLVQLANLRTHPAVAAAVAQGRLQIWGWLHAGELLSPGPGQTAFDRPVALHPDQNRYLRRERVLQRRPPSPRRVSPPYLA
jgi:carbonic anhydrase